MIPGFTDPDMLLVMIEASKTKEQYEKVLQYVDFDLMVLNRLQLRLADKIKTMEEI